VPSQVTSAAEMHRAQHIKEEVLLVLPVEEVLSHPCALELRVKHKRKKVFTHVRIDGVHMFRKVEFP
jgi:hypothetical protein